MIGRGVSTTRVFGPYESDHIKKGPVNLSV